MNQILKDSSNQLQFQMDQILLVILAGVILGLKIYKFRLNLKNTSNYQ